MQVWNVLHAARWKCRTQKIVKNSPSGHHHTTLSHYTFATKARVDNQKKNLLKSNTSSTCPHNMANFGPLTAEIGLPVWGTPANFNRFCLLAALLHGTLVVGPTILYTYLFTKQVVQLTKQTSTVIYKKITRMWANAQRDGRPASVQHRKVFWRPLLKCRAVTLPRRETCWNLQGCPKLPKRAQPLVGRSSPYCAGHVEEVLLFNIFFSNCRYVP